MAHVVLVTMVPICYVGHSYMLMKEHMVPHSIGMCEDRGPLLGLGEGGGACVYTGLGLWGGSHQLKL